MKKVALISLCFLFLFFGTACVNRGNIAQKGDLSKKQEQEKEMKQDGAKKETDFKCLEPKNIPTGFALKTTNLPGTICHYHYEGNGVLNFSFVNRITYEQRLEKEKAYDVNKYKILTEFNYLDNPGHVLGYAFDSGDYEEKWAEYRFQNGYLVVHSTNMEVDDLVEMVKKYHNQLSVDKK